MDEGERGRFAPRGAQWVAIGAVAGIASGAAFGLPYALAGLAIGLAGGAAIWLVLR
jgi:hypothetical protein